MSKIKINDLKSDELEYQKLSDYEVMLILGGCCCCHCHYEIDLGNIAGTGTPISAAEF